MPSSTGRLVAFEGTEGAGKSSQLRRAAEALKQDGRGVRVTVEPGGTALGERVRALLLGESDPVPTPVAELFLYLADRAQHVTEVIRPALDAGAVVFTDRFSASTIAYQGFGRGLDIDTVTQMDSWARGGLSPDLTLLLDCPVRMGLQRAHGHDRFHSEIEAFHERVRRGFLTLAAASGATWKVIDSTQPEDTVHQQIMVALRAVLNSR